MKECAANSLPWVFMEPLVGEALKNPVKMPGPPLSARQILSEGRKVDRATIEGNPLEALRTFGLREG